MVRGRRNAPEVARRWSGILPWAVPGGHRGSRNRLRVQISSSSIPPCGTASKAPVPPWPARKRSASPNRDCLRQGLCQGLHQDPAAKRPRPPPDRGCL